MVAVLNYMHGKKNFGLLRGPGPNAPWSPPYPLAHLS